jgi:hypothetical protein
MKVYIDMKQQVKLWSVEIIIIIDIIDPSQTFDKVPHTLLSDKLNNFGLS